MYVHVCMYVCVYIYIYMYVCMYVYVMDLYSVHWALINFKNSTQVSAFNQITVNPNLNRLIAIYEVSKDLI